MSVNPYETREKRRHRIADVTRRQFLLLLGALGSLGALIFAGIETLKFGFPNATLESPPVFRPAIDPATLSVDNPYMDYAHRVGIMRDDAGFYAVQLICTHLGCTPNYVTNVTNGTGVPAAAAARYGARRGAEGIPNGWACPCHGSRYFIDSTNFYGPAPRPMDWVDIQFGPDGKFVVDRSKLVVLRQAGQTTTPRWRLDPTTRKDNGKTLGV